MEIGITLAGFVLIGLMIYRHDNNVTKELDYLEKVITKQIKELPSDDPKDADTNIALGE